MKPGQFREMVWGHYAAHSRAMPWRERPTFYYVLVSELMLQQTQVTRVMTKFDEFIKLFPTIEALAASGLDEVLRAWQGLGYNRRAKFLHQAARAVVEHGQPNTRTALMQLPGIGTNTAGAIMNYVYAIPTPFVETNIRTVYLYHFFAGQDRVADHEIDALVEQTLDREHPREWFWALMDYGAWLKAQGVRNNAVSRHYKKQAPLKGSVREVRGAIVDVLRAGEVSIGELRTRLGRLADERFEPALRGLQYDGLVSKHRGTLRLTN